MQNSSIEVNSNLINDFDLPAGIEIAMDPATGRIFYIDHNTESTHWEVPAGCGYVPYHVKHAEKDFVYEKELIPQDKDKDAALSDYVPHHLRDHSTATETEVNKTKIEWIPYDSRIGVSVSKEDAATADSDSDSVDSYSSSSEDENGLHHHHHHHHRAHRHCGDTKQETTRSLVGRGTGG